MPLILGAGRISPQAARAAGASGFISKDWAAGDVARAVRMVGEGLTVFNPRSEAPAGRVSEREREVLTELAGAPPTRRSAGASTCLHTPSRSTRAGSTVSSRPKWAETVRRAERLGLID